MTYGHLQADCLYTGISSGPNARYRVWEAFTFLCYTNTLTYLLTYTAVRRDTSATRWVLSRVADILSQSRLRSSTSSQLMVRPSRLVTVGELSFAQCKEIQ